MTSTDPDLTEDLWRTHARDLLNFATVLVGPADAHDIVIESFLRAVPAIAEGHVASPRAYLHRAVHHQATDLRRARERRWRRNLAAIGPTSSVAPDTFVDVRRAISTLSLAQRGVVYLVWEDLTERAAAELLGVAPGTIRRHLVRARHHLRKALR